MQDTWLSWQSAASMPLSWHFGRVQTWMRLPVPRDTHRKSEAALPVQAAVIGYVA